MDNINSVILIGRLTRDPELRYVAGSGKAVCNFDIAVDRPFSKEKATDFFKVIVWGKTGENAANYLAKGRQVAVKGYLTNRSYDANDGTKRYVTEIVADTVDFIGSKQESKPEQHENQSFGEDFNTDGFQSIEDDDDIPF